MKKKKYFHLLIFFPIFIFIFIIGLPICSIFFNKNIDNYISLMIILSINFLITLFIYLIFCKKNKEIKDNNQIKIDFLKEILLKEDITKEKKIKISDEQKEIFKIFCNTLIEI